MVWSSTRRFRANWRKRRIVVGVPRRVKHRAELRHAVNEIASQALSFDQVTRDLINVGQGHRFDVSLSLEKPLARREVIRAVLIEKRP